MKFNSKSLLMLVVVVALLGFTYFAVSSKKSNEISLEITSPKDGDVVIKSPISVTGTTVKNAEVFINDAETKANGSGNFKVSIDLDEGENDIFVTVNDQDGNNTESSVKVNLNTE